MTTFDLNAGILAPVADEVELTDLTVRGTLPAELDGMLVRNGPNPFGGVAAGSTMLDWWVGPGMVHGVAIRDGRAAWYRNRWVRTGGWHDHQARRSGTAPPPAPAEGENGANVNVLAHGGRLLALGEGGTPYQLDAGLETIGRVDFDGQLPRGINAHPKVDPSSGELRFFRADWQPPFLQVGAIDREGRLTSLRPVELEKPVMMHDFAITETHDVVLDLGVVLDGDLLGAGAPLPLCWDDEHRARIGLVPRTGAAVRWFDIDPCFVQHVVNAYDRPEEGPAGTVVLDVVRYPHFLRFDPAAAAHLPNPLGELWRFELDLDTGIAAETRLDDRAIELPRIDERRTGRRHDRVISVSQPTDREMRGLIVHDLAAGTSDHVEVPPGDQNSEAVFVPSAATGAETAGWYLTCVYRAATDTTEVVVLDAGDPAAGPVATIDLPRRIPAGFHGSWTPRGAITG